MTSRSVPLSVTPGTLTATVPPMSPAMPAGLMTKKPLPPLSVTKFVVPSPNAALTFVTSTRTTLPALVVADSNTNEPLIRWPAKVSSRLSAVTRRYGPAGSASDAVPICSETAAPVVLTATAKVPLNLTGSPGILTATVPSTRPAMPVGRITNSAVPPVSSTPRRGLVADEQVHVGGRDLDDLRRRRACGRRRGDLLEAERARELLPEELEVQRGLDDDQLGGRVDLDRDVVDGQRIDARHGQLDAAADGGGDTRGRAVQRAGDGVDLEHLTEHELAGGQADLEVALGRARLEAESAAELHAANATTSVPVTCSSPGGDGLGQEARDVDDGRGGRACCR